MPSCLLDSNAVIALQQQNPALLHILADFDEKLISATVVGELYFGVLNSQQVTSNLDKLETLLNDFEILSIDQDTAFLYAYLRFRLKRIGSLIPENDMWIAAVAMQYDLTLVTRDAHFSKVVGLTTRSW